MSTSSGREGWMEEDVDCCPLMREGEGNVVFYVKGEVMGERVADSVEARPTI